VHNFQFLRDNGGGTDRVRGGRKIGVRGGRWCQAKDNANHMEMSLISCRSLSSLCKNSTYSMCAKLPTSKLSMPISKLMIKIGLGLFINL